MEPIERALVFVMALEEAVRTAAQALSEIPEAREILGELTDEELDALARCLVTIKVKGPLEFVKEVARAAGTEISRATRTEKPERTPSPRFSVSR
ncbi:hypothetical protein [Thermosulfurimonas sp. F29]|uniref:hypothetical protein n=1 Tax=Thermosulfurimonas sp. F29 TaxID=2867247 RepID=UPI001C83B667|nr:hypothetical protein [Thermosulfurimonas sp. F29]MBX6423389.1 hypothetical protein [Thermosulfurimonas sp. F29]